MSFSSTSFAVYQTLLTHCITGHSLAVLGENDY